MNWPPVLVGAFHEFLHRTDCRGKEGDLLKARCDFWYRTSSLERPDREGLTPLLHAARAGHSRCVKQFLELEARATKTCKYGGILKLAISSGSAETVKVVLKMTKIAKKCRNKAKYLVQAILQENERMVELLLMYDFTTHHTDIRKRIFLNPIKLAIEIKSSAILRLLLVDGAEVNVLNTIPVKYKKKYNCGDLNFPVYVVKEMIFNKYPLETGIAVLSLLYNFSASFVNLIGKDAFDSSLHLHNDRDWEKIQIPNMDFIDIWIHLSLLIQEAPNVNEEIALN